ncbi:hypothetical protein GCM10022415_31780 [Knoellia locipacati]|uniref:CobQ/CobB/MinD/ParA nucleotide binding domain-containing protein n=1 Tax=Knoellia locipacati TaxID=882824 RepID=A0A512T3M3_9MICO|nr:CpsD/CapB family tyrosine-protein kinase [Knoellia locipacati]GEQ14818.1 hypothetical protein KLO01_28650 [Knoellia locipacati]
MTLRDYLIVFRHYGALIVATILAAATLTWVLTPAHAQGPVTSYTATATLLAASSENPQLPPSLPLGRIALYVTTGVVPVRVAKKVGFVGQPTELAGRIDVGQDSEAMALTITSSNTDSKRAGLIVNTFADEAVAFFSGTRPEAAGTRLSILQRGIPVAEAHKGTLIPPGRPQRTGLAAGLGLLLGLAIALVLNRLDSRMRSREEIQEALGLPIIAEVPKLARGQRASAGTLVVTEPLSPFADGYRAARTAISHTLGRSAKPSDMSPRERRGTRTNHTPWVLVTSANPGDGKTTSVGNLAASFAESGKSVLVLDADLRSPDTHNVFDVPQGAGISDYLTDPDFGPLSNLVRPTNLPGVKIITAGTQLEHPTSLASRMVALQEGTRQLADVVIVDSAPLLAASEVFDLLPLVDTIMLVVRSGRLSETSGNRVSELLGRFRVPVSGVLLIGTSRSRGHGYGYGYGYGESGRRRSEKPVDHRAQRGAFDPAADEDGQSSDIDTHGSSGPRSAAVPGSGARSPRANRATG